MPSSLPHIPRKMGVFRQLAATYNISYQEMRDMRRRHPELSLTEIVDRLRKQTELEVNDDVKDSLMTPPTPPPTKLENDNEKLALAVINLSHAYQTQCRRIDQLEQTVETMAKQIAQLHDQLHNPQHLG